jgi:hypothetical protein
MRMQGSGAQTSVRVCGACGAPAVKHKQRCLRCGARLPATYSNRHPRTVTGEQRALARDRVLEGMRGPPCVCGLRGPHECTRTPAWKAECLALIAAKKSR